MRLRYQLQRDLKLKKHPFVLIGAISFFVLGLMSWCIGGNPRPTLIYLQNATGTVVMFIFFVLWSISYFCNGAVFGSMFAITERCHQLLANRIAVLIIIMHLFALFAYPLFFACYAWMLALIALILSAVFCVMAILLVRRISILASGILIVHFAILLWTIIRTATIIFMN